MSQLLEFVQILSELSDSLKQAGEEKRKDIADYFGNIERCLSQSVEKLQNDKVPNFQWGELQVYANDLNKNIGKEIGKQKADELTSLLLSIAQNIPTTNDISSIEKAAGKFKGLANTVSPKPGRRKIIYAAFGVTGLAGGYLFHKIIHPTPPTPPTPTDDKFPSVSWEMHTFLSESVEKTILYNAPKQVCDRVKQMTQGRFDITLKRTGETQEILEKVSAGTIQCGYSGIYYTDEKYRALFFGCAIPFGLSPQEQTAWLYYKKNPDDELTFIQSIYKERLGLNVIPFPAGATGGQMGGWFKAKINSLSDLKDKNKIIRIPGLGANVWQRLGITTHEELVKPISVDEAIQKLKNGDFFAVEWTSPYDDLQLGLDRAAAKFYYHPGWWEPSTTFDVQVNIYAWNKLPSHYQEIFKLACHETYTSILTEYDQKNSLALKEIANKGIQLLPFDDEVLKAAEKETKALLELYAKNDSVFKEIYDEWLNFKDRIRAWSKLTKIE
jgi:TRAP-type mannitol/chloroaromatic compound transport system substrate-binding protein